MNKCFTNKARGADANVLSENGGTLDIFRESIFSELPELLRKATEQYRRFSASNPPDDAKAFASHQSACRAALGHVQMLIKLAHWAGYQGGHGLNSAGEDGLEYLVCEARLALKAHYPEDDF